VISTPTPGVNITQPGSPYPDTTPGRTAQNLTAYQFSTTQNFPCGADIQFFLSVQTAANGTFVLPFVLPSGSHRTPVTFALNTPMPINDFGVTDSTIVISNVGGTVGKLTLSLYLTNAGLSNIIAFLLPPGPSQFLFQSLPASQLGQDCGTNRFVLDDAAPRSLSDGPPYVGAFHPDFPLTHLAGLPVDGTWVLRLIDNRSNSITGTLFCWSMTIEPVDCTDGGGPCDICNGVFFGSITTNDTKLSMTIGGVQPTTCGTTNPCGITAATAMFTDVYMFTNRAGPACVTVTVDAPCLSPSNSLLSTAFLHGPVPTNFCAEFLGFSGALTNSPASYSFNIPSNAVFAVNLSGGSPFGFGLCSNYSLRVDGFSCPVPLCASKTTIGTSTGTNLSIITLCWPTTGSSMTLESTTNLASANWTAITNEPIARNGNFVLTNAIIAPRQFYRLHKE